MMPALSIANAPHRLLFAIGAANVLLAMLWWALWLVDARWQVIGLSQPVVYAGWLHAIVMQYQVLAPFMFGFLITVFPKWMGLQDLTRWHYVPAGVGQPLLRDGRHVRGKRRRLGTAGAERFQLARPDMWQGLERGRAIH